jgi:two-component system nitrogen regulation response regulator NtrX
MAQLREQVAMAAPTNGRVLIFGKNGTGEELVARSIHTLSRRRPGPFVEVNCAAIPEELIESELFGHFKGAFTGAVSDRRGKFEAADGGTLFLDEIGDMSLKTQAKVLRALEEQIVEPLRGTTSVKVTSACSRRPTDLPSEIEEGGSTRISISPECHSFSCRVAGSRCGHSTPGGAFHGELAREMRAQGQTSRYQRRDGSPQHRWPGNVRELRNVIERLMIMVPGDVITLADLEFLEGAAMASAEPEGAPPLSLHDARERFERDFILRALAAQQGNISKTADILGVERSNLYRKMRARGLCRRAGRVGVIGFQKPAASSQNYFNLFSSTCSGPNPSICR